eukprot:2147306-Prymnesium_polylepis.3
MSLKVWPGKLPITARRLRTKITSSAIEHPSAKRAPVHVVTAGTSLNRTNVVTVVDRNNRTKTIHTATSMRVQDLAARSMSACDCKSRCAARILNTTR